MEKRSDVLIVCATKNEYITIVNTFGLDLKYRRNELYIAHGIHMSYHIFCLHTGVGVENTIFCLNRFLQHLKPQIIIDFGAAGSINPHIKAGMIVTPIHIKRINGLQFTELINCKSYFCIEPGIIPAKMGTVDRFTYSRKKKAGLTEQSIDVIDCESYAIAKFCIHNSIDYFILRGITDYAGPVALMQYFWNEKQVLKKGANALLHILNKNCYTSGE